ncbi:MAG: hypothetical protein M3162_03280 [Thermoproteota archaeon]|nr:hypothetical protein [Thermoproteota archaeon]
MVQMTFVTRIKTNSPFQLKKGDIFTNRYQLIQLSTTLKHISFEKLADELIS